MDRQELSAWRDEELVAAARRHDRDAFATLVSRHRPLALRVTTRVIGHNDLAGDAVQEAVVVAMLSLDRLAEPERFGAWLCGIALNIARRWLRKPVALPLSATEWVPPGGDPADLAEQADIAARVRRAIDELPPGQRDAVLLFYLQGLTHREVADELAISVGAVKARLHQARASLSVRLVPLVDHQEVSPMTASTEATWVEMVVAEVRRGDGPNSFDRPHVVVLRERHGTRELPIWVGAPEAIALAMTVESEQMPRPMTYQFAANLLDASRAHAVEIRITAIVDGTYYAVVVIEGPGGSDPVDARPSDALNLALITGAAILVDGQILVDEGTADRIQWKNYSTGAADIVTEVRDRQAAAMARWKEERENANLPTE